VAAEAAEPPERSMEVGKGIVHMVASEGLV